jgi:hypothetical protein
MLMMMVVVMQTEREGQRAREVSKRREAWREARNRKKRPSARRRRQRCVC